MDIDLCIDIFNENFPLFHLTKDIIVYLLNQSSVIDGKDKEIPNLKVETKYQLYLLVRFYKKSTIFMNNLLNKFKSSHNDKIHFKELFDQFNLINRDMDFNEEIINSIFSSYFTIEDDNCIKLESLFTFFKEKSYTFKIKVIDYIEISMKNFIYLYGFLEKKLSLIFDKFVMKQDGLMGIKEFQNAFLSIIGGSEREWTITPFFK